MTAAEKLGLIMRAGKTARVGEHEWSHSRRLAKSEKASARVLVQEEREGAEPSQASLRPGGRNGMGAGGESGIGWVVLTVGYSLCPK